jgi:hypothetical protein
MTQGYRPLQDIVDEIKKLHRSRADGTLFVATGANKSAQILFKDGNIVSIYFYNMHGREALEKMSVIEVGRYRFQEGFASIRRKSDLPETSVILATLDGFCGDKSSADSAQPISSEGGLTDEQKSILEKCLVEYIGPMAAIICEDHFFGGAGLRETVDKLTSEIPSPQQAAQFKEEVLGKLG